MNRMTTPKEKVLQKHPSLTPEDVYKKELDRNEAIKKYQDDITNAEDNLINFLNKEDPLIDPGTGKAMAWLRRLPYKEIRELTPSDAMEAYKSGDKEALEKVAKENEDFTFVMMEKIISKPSKSAAEWKEIANIQFIELFQARVAELMFRVEEQMSFL